MDVVGDWMEEMDCVVPYSALSWAMYTAEGLFTAAVGSGKLVEAAGGVSRGVYGTA
jgi:hypothetical protein